MSFNDIGSRIKAQIEEKRASNSVEVTKEEYINFMGDCVTEVVISDEFTDAEKVEALKNMQGHIVEARKVFASGRQRVPITATPWRHPRQLLHSSRPARLDQGLRQGSAMYGLYAKSQTAEAKPEQIEAAPAPVEKSAPVDVDTKTAKERMFRQAIANEIKAGIE